MGGCKNCRHPNAIPYDDEVSAVTKCESTLTTTERDECSNSSDIDVLCTWEYKNMGDYKNCRHPNAIPYDEVSARVTKCGFTLTTERDNYINSSYIDVLCPCPGGLVFTTQLYSLETGHTGGCKNCHKTRVVVPYDEVRERVTNCGFTLVTERNNYDSSQNMLCFVFLLTMG